MQVVDDADEIIASSTSRWIWFARGLSGSPRRGRISGYWKVFEGASEATIYSSRLPLTDFLSWWAEMGNSMVGGGCGDGGGYVD